jgi:hypothetical protein
MAVVLAYGSRSWPDKFRQNYPQRNASITAAGENAWSLQLFIDRDYAQD